MSLPHVSEEKLAGDQLEQPNTHDALRGEEAEDSKFARKTMRKVDIHVLPIFGLIYTIAYVDRANISVARISGLDEDLDLDVRSRASITLLLFFVGYIIFELPSNILIKRVGAPNWISIITIAWGAFTIGQGFVHSWIDLAVLRVFLGAFEAGLYPGFVYLITCWYKRYEVQKRLAVFYFLAQGLASFGNILALGLIQISQYTPNYNGWRWIYIIEGAITVLVGFTSRFIIVDFPASHRTTFLNERQKAWVLRRLQDDVGDEDKSPVSWAILWSTVKDWQIWCYSFMYMTGAIGGYGLTLFLPIILQDSLGFSQKLAFILVVPPVLFSVLVGWTASWLADKLRVRGPIIVMLGCLAFIGFCMVGFVSNSAARLVGIFLGYAGVNGFVVTSIAWQANNIRGDAKRAIATAIIVMMSGVGGIYPSLTFRQQDAPNYVPGIISVLVPSVVTILLAIATSFVLKKHNKEADEGKRIIEGSKEFRYTL